MIDGYCRPRAEDRGAEEETRDKRPDADRRGLQRHRSEGGRPVKHHAPRSVRLHDRVCIPEHIETELLSPVPSLVQLRQWKVLILIRTEPESGHRDPHLRKCPEATGPARSGPRAAEMKRVVTR